MLLKRREAFFRIYGYVPQNSARDYSRSANSRKSYRLGTPRRCRNPGWLRTLRCRSALDPGIAQLRDGDLGFFLVARAVWCSRGYRPYGEKVVPPNHCKHDPSRLRSGVRHRCPRRLAAGRHEPADVERTAMPGVGARALRADAHRGRWGSVAVPVRVRFVWT